MNTNSGDTFDVAIVGAGMVGLSLACALSRLDLTIAIIDRATVPDKNTWQGYDPRVSAIVKSSENFLINIGAWDYIQQERHCAYSGMDVWEKDGTGNIQFDCTELNRGGSAFSELGFIVENRIMQWAMHSVLLTKNNITWFCPETIEHFELSDKVNPKKSWDINFQSGKQVSAQLLVGADGALSFVREKLSIELDVKNLNHKAIVCNVETELPHNKIARQIFLPSGPLAFLPLSETVPRNGLQTNDNTCSIVCSSSPEVSDELMQLSEKDFNKKLSQMFENTLGAVTRSDQRFSFPLYQRHAKTYFTQQAVLIGDAAHTIHPLAGQGVNLGYMDAAVLAEEIERALNRSISISSREVLRRYQRRRKGQVTLMMESMRGFQHLYAARNADLIGLRNLGVKLTNAFSPIKNHLLSRAMGIDGDVPELAKAK